MRLFLVILILSLVGVAVSAQNLDSINSKLNKIDTPSIAAKDTLSLTAADSLAIMRDTLSIIGVGDIMMGTNYPEDKLPPRDGKFLLREVESILQDADVTFGNLEGTLLDEGGIPKKCNDPKSLLCVSDSGPIC